jgi:hypothetical protein
MKTQAKRAVDMFAEIRKRLEDDFAADNDAVKNADTVALGLTQAVLIADSIDGLNDIGDAIKDVANNLSDIGPNISSAGRDIANAIERGQ